MKFEDKERTLPYQCSVGLAKNMGETSDGLDLFLEWKSEKNKLKCGWTFIPQISSMTYPIENRMKILQMDGVVETNEP